jgi:hypothetical protein
MHCFGDFGLPYYRGNLSEVFVSGNIAAANTPIVILAFQIFELIPYNVALASFLGIMIVGVIATALWGSRNLPSLNVAVAIFAGGLGAVGVIIGLDRGNWIVLYAPLVLIYCVALQKGRQTWAVAALTLMAVLKFWGIVLVVGLLAQRRYRAAATSATLTIFLYIASLSLISGRWEEKIRIMLETATNREYGSNVSRFGVSIYSFIVRMNCFARDSASCDPDSPALALPYATVVAILVFLTLCFWAFAMLREHGERDNFLAYAPLISLVFLAVPEAGGYNLSVMVAVIAILNRNGSPTLGDPRSHHQRTAALTWTIALALSVLPLPIWLFPAENATGPLANFGLWRLYQITVPVAWMVVILLSSRDIVVRNRKPDRATP